MQTYEGAFGGTVWIWAAVLAALCQALRYAALKELNKHLSVAVTSYARILFATPVLLAYLGCVLAATKTPMPHMSPWFLLFACLTAIGQFLGTILMVRLFQMGNFAVGTMLTKADTILTALLGTLLLTEQIPPLGWGAILVTVAGVIVVSTARIPASAWRAGDIPLWRVVLSPSTQLGLLISLINAICYLMLREAIVTLKSSGGVPVDAAVAGTMMTVFSCILLGGWLLATDRAGLKALGNHIGLCTFVGSVSALGTILWYLAAALTNVSYVAAVAQVQIVFALLLSRYWFRETIWPKELVGISIILAGILLFRTV
jgi:drug/metabolite transporter (DMT)-like permease